MVSRYAGNSDKIAHTLDQFLARLAATGERLPAPRKPGRPPKDASAKAPVAASKAVSKARGNSRAATGATRRGVTDSMASGWTSAEDAQLRALVHRHGACRWADKVKQLGGHRSENAVRSRWHIYLRPDAPCSLTPSSSAATEARAARAAPAEKNDTSKHTVHPKPVQSIGRGAISNTSRTYSYLPQASYFAEDGEEELTAAVAVAIEPPAKAATTGAAASGSAISTLGPPLAREWTSLPKKARETMLANQPEAAEPLRDPATAAAALPGVCTPVARSDTGPLPPMPPPVLASTSTSIERISAVPSGKAHRRREHQQQQQQKERGKDSLSLAGRLKRRAKEQTREPKTVRRR